MDNIINLKIPHVGEQIFQNLKPHNLIQLCTVSETWKTLIENVLVKKWRGKLSEAWTGTFYRGKIEVLEVLLKHEVVQTSEAKDIFRWACEGGHKSIVKLLLDKFEQEPIGNVEFFSNCCLFCTLSGVSIWHLAAVC